MEKVINIVHGSVMKLESTSARYAPVCYILISTFLLAFQSLLSKFILAIPASQIVYSRGVIMCILNTIITQIYKVQIYGFNSEINKKLFFRSMFGCFGTITFYWGMKLISISEGQVLFRTSPLWTSLMAIYYLKTEQLTKNLIVNILLCFSGIILITQPRFLLEMLGLHYKDHEVETQILGVILMLSAAMFSSIIQVLINTLAEQVNQLVILQYFSSISTGISSLAYVIFPDKGWQIPDYHELFFLFLIGFTSYLSQLLMNRAYMKGRLTEISMLGQTQVIHGFIFDLMMGAQLSYLSILGTILILISLIKVVLEKQKKKKNPAN